MRYRPPAPGLGAHRQSAKGSPKPPPPKDAPASGDLVTTLVEDADEYDLWARQLAAV